MTTSTAPPGDATRRRAVQIAGVTLTLVIAAAGLWWAKWAPYSQKANSLADSRTWSGSAIFGTAGEPGATPTLHGMWEFTTTYVKAVWRAAVVAILVAAALEALVPKQWLLRLMSCRTGLGQGLAGGALALPSMMCTCCTAPVAVGLRRRGAPAAATIAYWLSNPLLNPAVLLFLGLTLPGRYLLVRLVVGIAVVVVTALVAARLRPSLAAEAAAVTDTDDAQRPAELLTRFLRAVLRYVLILVPEYLVLVLLTGLLSGWLSDFTGLDTQLGPAALLVIALVGACLVIPTGGEIPVIAGLLAAGASPAVAGVLLIVLPALSIPSAVMVARSFGPKLTAASAVVVMLGGLVAAALIRAF